MQLAEAQRRLRSNFYFAAAFGLPLLVMCALELDDLARRPHQGTWANLVAGEAILTAAVMVALLLAGRAVPASLRTGGHGLRQVLLVAWLAGLASAALTLGLAVRGFGVALCGLTVVQLAIVTYLRTVVRRVGDAVSQLPGARRVRSRS